MRELPIQSNIPENIKASVKEVSIKGLEATEKYIPESDPLKEYATRLFLNLESEYKRIQEKSLSDDDIKEEMEKVSAIFENKARFVEEVQKLKEKEEARVRLKERLKQNPLATDEEFSAGVYKDELESQVSEAVFTFKRKGYETFESGFDIGRDQMIGVYNKNIVLPQSIIDSFKQRGIKISVLERKDRTSIILHPLADKIITLKEWKSIWDDLAEMMPAVESIKTDQDKEAAAHSDFREKQQKILEGKNIYLGDGTAYIEGKPVAMSYDEFYKKYNE